MELLANEGIWKTNLTVKLSPSMEQSLVGKSVEYVKRAWECTCCDSYDNKYNVSYRLYKARNNWNNGVNTLKNMKGEWFWCYLIQFLWVIKKWGWRNLIWSNFGKINVCSNFD